MSVDAWWGYETNVRILERDEEKPPSTCPAAIRDSKIDGTPEYAMRKTKSTAGLGLSTGLSDNNGDFNDQFAWESPAVGKGMRRQLSSSAVMQTMMDEGKNENLEGTQPPLPQANNFMRGYHQNSSSNLQRSSKARGLGEGGTASKLIFKKDKKNLLSFADEEGADDADALEPKVFIPHETAPGHTPRKVAIRRLKAEYLAQNIPATLENAGIAKAIYGQLADFSNYPQSGGTKDEGVKQQLQGDKGPSSAMSSLPLSIFDDLTYEMYEIEKWVEYKSHARAVFVPPEQRRSNATTNNISATTEWKPCRVVSLLKPDGM